LKTASLIILILAIAVFYSIPTMYEAVIEHKLNQTSHRIIKDMLDARQQAIKTGNPAALVFNTEENSYAVFDNGKETKKVLLKDINKAIVFYTGIFQDGISLADNSVTFDKYGICDIHSDDKRPAYADSIYLIHKRDQAKNLLERIVRIYINKENCSISQLKVKKLNDQGELVFGE
jgi:hypothetical protein